MNFIMLRKLMPLPRGIIQRITRVMRITTILFIAFCLHVSASGNAQKLSIHVENMPLKGVFAEIRKQAGYVFMVNDNILLKAKPVTISASNATVDEVLTECMKGQPL